MFSMRVWLLAVLGVFGLYRAGLAVNYAVEVVSYQPGGDASLGYRTPEAALGLPNPIADPIFGNTILSPFNPPWLPSDIVIIGEAGELTLRLAYPVAPLGGRREIGVFVNNGLIDVDYPRGQAGSPAGYFSPPPRAIVSVSDNGSTWVQLDSSPIVFGNPTNYYSDLGENPSSTSIAGSQVADFTAEFLGQLSDFDGLDWAGIKALLNGTAGGQWLDISQSGLGQVNYIRFEVPTGAGYRCVIDAVTAVPEPGVIWLLTAMGPMCLRFRRQAAC